MGADRTTTNDEERHRDGSTTRRGVLQAAGVTAAVALGVGTKAELTAARRDTAAGYGGTPRVPDAAPSGTPAGRATRLPTDRRVVGRFTRRDTWYSFDGDADRVAVRFQQPEGVSAIGVYGPEGDLLQQAFAASADPVYLPTTTDLDGTHYVQVADVSGGSSAFSVTVRETDAAANTTQSSDDGQSPYQGTVTALPGRVEAENFDLGGQGVAYDDTTAENVYGDTYRDTAVDVRETRDADGAYNVGYFERGEWLEYTVDPEPGTYDVQFRVATPRADRRLRLLLDGEELATVSVSDTGGWRSWETVTVEDVAVPRDAQSVLRVECLDSGIDLNWIGFDITQRQEPFGDAAAPIPGQIEAEDFDTGGAGVAYTDTTAGNEYGDVYRESDADIRETQDGDGGYNLGYVAEGEWWEYTVAPEGGTYDLTVRAATPRTDRRVRFAVAGQEIATVAVSETGGWRSWETVTVEDVSVPDVEQATLRVTALDAGVDLDWFTFEQTGTTEQPTQNPFEGTIAELPGRVQAENFDTGGQGVSYSDTTAGNEYGDVYRDTDADVRETQDTSGGYTLGYVADGEWWEYTVDPAPGTYDVRVRVATPLQDRRLQLSLAGEELGTVSVSDTGGWRSWETVALNDVTIERDAQSVLRVEALDDGIDVNWVEFAPSTDYGEVAYGEGGYGRETTEDA